MKEEPRGLEFYKCYERQRKAKTPPAILTRESLLADMPEKVFQEQVRHDAIRNLWEPYHTWNSIHSPAGFPDLVLLRPPRLVIAELKRVGKEPTAKQEKWLDLWRQIPGAEVYVWTPMDQDEIERVLK